MENPSTWNGFKYLLTNVVGVFSSYLVEGRFMQMIKLKIRRQQQRKES